MSFHTLIGLSRKAGIKHSEFLAISANIDRNYRKFKLAKRSGGTREIVAPKPGLKAIQRTLADEINARAGANRHAHGYVMGRSIKTHALVHMGSDSFVKIDIEGFFPSITEDRVNKVLTRLDFRPEIIPTLVKLCCFGGTLPQGSPASPPISNLCLAEIDQNLEAFANAHSLKYSRYVDDLVLSGVSDDFALLDLATKIVEDGGYRVNIWKSFFAHKPKKLVLTGISMASGELKVPKPYKRAVRREAYRLASKGTSFMFAEGRFNPFAFDKLMGQLGFWAWVEPSASFPKRYLALFADRYSKGKSFPKVQPPDAPLAAD